MEVLSSTLPNTFSNFSSFSKKSNRRLTIKRTQHQFNLPISKFLHYRTSILRVSAQFKETSRRRNSLRKKIISDENFRSNHTSSDPLNKNHNINHSDDSVEVSNVEGLKIRVSKDSDLMNELEDWVLRYQKETEYWGIGSNPIFIIHHDSIGKVKKVEVNEDEILSRKSESVSSSSSRVQYAKELAEKLKNGENVIHKDSSLVKFVPLKEEVSLVSSIRNSVLRFELIPKFSVIGKAVLCGYIGLWLLKVVFMNKKKSNEVECTELEKEMMRRKMKAWKQKEMVEKVSVEVIQPLRSIEKPRFDRKELMSSISKVKGNSSQLEIGESMGFDDKIKEIKVMARRAREIELNGVNSKTDENDEDISDPHEVSTHIKDDESDKKNIEVSGVAAPMVNGTTLDLAYSNHEVATSNEEKESNEVPLDPMDRIIQSSDVSKDKLSMMKTNTSRKSRVIRSVKEAKEFLSTRTEEKELIQKRSQNSDEISPEQSNEEARKSESVEKDKIFVADINGSGKEEEHTTSTFESVKSSTIEKEQSSGKENWMEKNYNEIKPIVEKMRVGFRDNYMAARENEQPKEPSTISEIVELYRNEDNDELEWMKDEKLRDIVFHVRDNELAGKDPFHLIDDEAKAMFLQGLEKKVEKENEKLSHLHQWIHSNIENLDYGIDGISVYDPPEKVIPKWKGPTLEKNPEFLNNYNEQREALFSRKAESSSPVKKKEQSSLQDSSTSPSKTTLNQPKIVIEGSDGSIKPGKKSGKEYWQHTKKWSRGFLELYNAETDPEVKAIMKDMGKDLDRWITEDEIKDAADIMEKLPEKNKKFMEKKLNKLKREMELFGPQAVVSKYREYGEDKEEDYLWWLDLPHVLCLEMYTVDDKGEQQVGFYTLEMAKDLELEPKPHHVIGFENAADCRNLCYIIQAHLDMLRTGSVFIVPRPPKDAFREAKANGFGVTVIKKGELKLNIDEPLEEVEEKICEIGSKMYHDKIMGDRSVDISSLMKGVFNLKNKPTGRRRKRALKDSNKKK